ncbi:uncharacterized protein LOC108320085 [Vigna angularis]|uniref:uncharacterized protein LOC108320085 n=1 Tax=Phaseolus angularis TaxID=3914 RepID=UPI000809EAB7|nr:uncharacterized protein LOC108320085 [Vigna angularis]
MRQIFLRLISHIVNLSYSRTVNSDQPEHGFNYSAIRPQLVGYLTSQVFGHSASTVPLSMVLSVQVLDHPASKILSHSASKVDLCGDQLRKSFPGDGDQTIVTLSKAEAMNDDEDSCFYEALYMSMGIGYFTGFWSLVGPMLLWRSWRNAYLRFLNKLTDNMYDQLY